MRCTPIILILLSLCIIPAVSATYPFTVWGLPNDTTSTFPALSTADVNAMCLDVLGGNAAMSGDYPTSQVVKKVQSCDDVNAGACTGGMANIGIGNNITIYPTSSASNWTVYAMCKRTSPPLGNLGVRYSFYLNASPPLPTANFVGSPLIGSAPQLITLNDTSTGGIATSWNWTGSGPGPLLWGNLTTRDTSVYLPNDGNYTITHCVANNAGSDCETKNDYISLYNASNSTSTTGCLAVSGPTGQRIADAQVDLFDIQNSSWTNTTTTAGLGTIVTLKGHTINCYASATGFKDGDLLAQPEINGQFYTLPLWPSGGYRNVTSGWVTLYVTVTDLATGEPIAGARVSGGDNNYGTTVNSSAFSLTTNSQGMANVPVKNNTVVYLTAYKPGYTQLEAAVNTGTANGGDAHVSYWFKLSKGSVALPGTTITTLPGGGYPTTQRTIDPAGTPDPSGGSSAYSSNKGQQMMDYLAMNGMNLVQLCFLVTVLGLLGIKLGK